MSQVNANTVYEATLLRRVHVLYSKLYEIILRNFLHFVEYVPVWSFILNTILHRCTRAYLYFRGGERDQNRGHPNERETVSETKCC